MTDTNIQWDVACPCGAATLHLVGEPAAQVYCHCDDCQRAHSAAYVKRALFPRENVSTSGDTRVWRNRTRDMMICAACGTHLYGFSEKNPFWGVNASLFPAGRFAPIAHLHCRHAVMPVQDDLPHYADIPREYGGSGERVSW